MPKVLMFKVPGATSRRDAERRARNRVGRSYKVREVKPSRDGGYFAVATERE